MLSEQTIDARISSLFNEIRFPDEPKGLYDPLRYMISIGGKRIRPKLCLTVYGLFRDDVGPHILEPAAALEVFHNFTLIHDDIMDNSPLRRGKETVWKKWDCNTAILSGDAMLIDSYCRIAKAPAEVLPKALSLFNRTAVLIHDGQQMDMDFESRDSVRMDEYIGMIARKTAVLLACSAGLGAIIAGQDDRICGNMYDFGYNLGLAFQIADDYLDTYGDSAVFGKPIGGDILNCKKTWLTIRAMEKGAKDLREALAQMAETPGEKAAKIDCVKDIYDSVGIRGEALAEIEAFHGKALSCAKDGISADAFAILRNFGESLIGRNS